MTTKYTYQLSDWSCRRLVAGILIQAAKDRKDTRYATDVEDFTKSNWFELLAEMVEKVDMPAACNMLQTSKFELDDIRAAYR